MNNSASFLAGKRLHIFIADDDPDDVDLFGMAVRELTWNTKITVAKNGRELVEFAQVVLPDLVFLDINMPYMNGLDCLAQLRQLKHLEYVPIIMYSTTASQHDMDRSYSLGANRYIKKPRQFSAIKEQLSQVLALSFRDLMPQPPRHQYLLDLEAYVHPHQWDRDVFPG